MASLVSKMSRIVLQKIENALYDHKISDSTYNNIKKWLTNGKDSSEPEARNEIMYQLVFRFDQTSPYRRYGSNADADKIMRRLRNPKTGKLFERIQTKEIEQ